MTWATALDRMNKTIRSKFPSVAIHTPIEGEPTEHDCVHDFMWVETSIGGAIQSSQKHTAWVRILDLVTYPAQDDAYSIDGVDYVIIDVQADGSGGARLILNKAE